MNLLVLDFETFFSADYTLKKMTTESYIRDPRFEALCCAFRQGRDFVTGEGPPFVHWQNAEGTAVTLDLVDWSQTAVVCHHAQFDGLILSHHYGIKPAYWFDTLSMARLVFGPHVPLSLGKLAERFGLEEKSVPYDLFKGKRWEELGADGQQALGDGCARDAELTHQIFLRLLPLVPREELDLIDLTIRMFTEPVLQGDVDELEAIAEEEAARKQALMDELGVRKSELASADQFAAILTGIGVEVEYKTTPKGNSIPAVAKTDEFMKELLDGDNELVAALAEARLGARSTIDETRAARLAGVARRGDLPIYLGYCAAHTLRWGGGDSLNFQNFRRGGRIRKALKAPDGHLLLVADAAQIEARFLEWFAGETESLARWRAGIDQYCISASDFYGREIVKADKPERGLGKLIVLSCGYGAGGPSIVQTGKRGVYGPPVFLTDEQGVAARDLYRQSRPGVPTTWREGDRALDFMGGAVAGEMEWRCLVVGANGDGTGHIQGPTGVRMLYALEYDAGERKWRRKTRKGWVGVWGGVVVQNVIELLSRLYLGAAVLKVQRDLGLRAIWVTHDETVSVVRDDQWAPHLLEGVLAVMREPPAWAPDIPLDAEGTLSERYEK